eukprot:4015874-Prymnesium_polylepis.1
MAGSGSREKLAVRACTAATPSCCCLRMASVFCSSTLMRCVIPLSCDASSPTCESRSAAAAAP